MGDEDDRYFFFSRSPGKAIYSRAIRSFTGKKVRIVSEIVDGEEGLRFAIIKDELILRTTPTGRYKYKATFVEDDRKIRSLVFQRYHHRTGPVDGDSFTIVGNEIENLLNFLVGIRTVELDDDSKKHVTNEQLRELATVGRCQARRLFPRYLAPEVPQINPERGNGTRAFDRELEGLPHRARWAIRSYDDSPSVRGPVNRKYPPLRARAWLADIHRNRGPLHIIERRPH